MRCYEIELQAWLAYRVDLLPAPIRHHYVIIL